MQPDDRSRPRVQDVVEHVDPVDRTLDGARRPDKASGAGKARAVNGDRDMGLALRSVYQKTVDESVPADLLDLLGKLD